MLVTLGALLAAGASDARAQTDSAVVGTGDIVSALGAGVLILAPTLFGAPDSVTCVPCDRMSVPAFDRWAISRSRRAPALASDFLALGMTASSWIDLADEGRAGQRGIAASAQSALWAMGATEVLKELVARRRPVLYTEEGIPRAAHERDQRSWPSAHAAGAAAIATSYLLTRHRSGEGGGAHGWLLVASALAIGGLRVGAGAHFPSDVLAGYAVGAASAWVVHEIEF